MKIVCYLQVWMPMASNAHPVGVVGILKLLLYVPVLGPIGQYIAMYCQAGIHAGTYNRNFRVWELMAKQVQTRKRFWPKEILYFLLSEWSV